jgi:hypothetical protein
MTRTDSRCVLSDAPHRRDCHGARFRHQWCVASHSGAAQNRGEGIASVLQNIYSLTRAPWQSRRWGASERTQRESVLVIGRHHSHDHRAHRPGCSGPRGRQAVHWGADGRSATAQRTTDNCGRCRRVDGGAAAASAGLWCVGNEKRTKPRDAPAGRRPRDRVVAA